MSKRRGFRDEPVTAPAFDAADEDTVLPAADLPEPPRRLGDVLVDRGVLTHDEVTQALELRRDAPVKRRRLGQVIVDNDLADEREVADALGELFGLPVVSLAAEVISVEAGRLLPKAVALRNGLLVLDKDENGTIRVATPDPKNVLALDDLRMHTGAEHVEVVITTESDLRLQIEKVWSISNDTDEVTATLGLDESAADEVEDAVMSADEAPIVRLVASVLNDAIRMGASDVHVEPLRRGLRIRMRVDGVLRETLTVPHGSRAAFTSRIKIISGLDISERRRPQDGRTRIDLGDLSVDARVSTLPSMHGETVVIRLLARAETTQRVDELGFEDNQLRAVRDALARSQGLVLITGPTGSGKTSTLFSALQEIHDVTRNIITLEDPVEIQLPGITQVQINEKAGLTFATGLRSVLRQDPDVVLVGEVRDSETAELALRASLTGHLVLTTVHTNDAVSALTRFVDMGVAPYLVASSLSLVVAQRLVRRPCDACAEPYEPPDDVLAMLEVDRSFLEGGSPRSGAGCRLCNDSGYLGRRGVFEVLEVTQAVRRTLLSDPTEGALLAATAKDQPLTLRDHALLLAKSGGTTFEEVLRVTR